MRLFQIAFSHNCVKVRRALDLKGLHYETVDVNPVDRRELRRESGQVLVPALLDDGRVVADSTAILLYLEERYPHPALLPDDPDLRSECLVLEDWADAAFMALTRRLAYSAVLAHPGMLANLFFPALPVRVRRALSVPMALALRSRFKMSEKQDRRDEREARRVAALAAERIGDRPFLVGDAISIADVTLAAMAAPLQYAGSAVRSDPGVQRLLEWSKGVLADDYTPRQFTLLQAA